MRKTFNSRKSVIDLLVWLGLASVVFASQFGNDIRGTFSCPSGTATVILTPGLQCGMVGFANTGSVAIVIWSGSITNKDKNGTVIGTDNTVTNINKGGWYLAPSNGVLAIQMDGVTEQRPWYGQGIGGTATGTSTQRPITVP